MSLAVWFSDEQVRVICSSVVLCVMVACGAAVVWKRGWPF